MCLTGPIEKYVQVNMSHVALIKNGLNEEDTLPPLFFNLASQYAIRDFH
jgi:hypothetical protein